MVATHLNYYFKNRDEKLPKTVPKGIIILYAFPQRSHNLVPKVLDNHIAQKGI